MLHRINAEKKEAINERKRTKQKIIMGTKMDKKKKERLVKNKSKY